MSSTTGEENAGGVAERTRSRTQNGPDSVSDEEERTERLRVLIMSEQENSVGVGPGAMLAHREPLNSIPTTLEMIPTQHRVKSLETTPLETPPEIRAMQATIAEMANNINVLVQAVTRLNETNRPRRSVSANSNVSHRSGSEHGLSVEGAICSFFRKGKCKDGDHCRFRHSLSPDDPRGDKSRPDGGCQVPLEVTNVPDKRNIKVPLLGTDDRRPISAFTNASSVGVNSGGATKENSVDSRLRPVVASTVSNGLGLHIQQSEYSVCIIR